MPRTKTTPLRLKEGRRLSRLRSKLGLTQRALAEEFNVTAAAITHWEQGRRTIPGPVLRLITIYESSALALVRLKK